MAEAVRENEKAVMSEEDKRTIDACMDRFMISDVVATLKELRSDDGTSVRHADIDQRVTTATTNKISLLNNFTLIDLKFKTKDRHEMLSFRTFFNAYIDRKTEATKNQDMKDYMLVFDFISADEKEETAYRTTMFDPIMCFMEEINNDYVLHILFETNKLDFYVEKYDAMELKAMIEYAQVQAEEEGKKFTSSSSELDEDENAENDDPYYIDNM